MSGPRPADAPVPRVRPWSRRAAIGLYVACAFFFWVSLYLYVPTLPTYLQTKTSSLATVGTVLSMYGLWQAVVRLPLGVAVDWLGRRKPFIIGGLVLAGVGAWTMGAAEDPTGLLVGRSITGVAAGAWVPMLVAFNSLFPAEEAVKATAMLTFVNAGGRILATASTGLLNNWTGYVLPFFLAAGVAGLAILSIAPAVEESRPRTRPTIEGITRLVTRPDVLLPSLLAAIGQYANWTTTFAFTPILASELGGSDVAQSLLVSINLLALLLGSLCATPLTRRFGPRSVVLSSFLLFAAGVALTAIAGSLPMLFVIQLLIGMSQGINIPVLMGLSIRYVGESERNTAMGLHQSVYAVGMFCGPWLSGILAQAVGIRPMLLATALGTLVLGLPVASALGRRPD
jgi:MFS family permease